MDIIYKDPKLLSPYPGNAKKHSKPQIDKVALSIQRFGFKQPVVIDGNDVIVIGHCRTLAAVQIGLAEIPCILADDLTPEQIRELRLIDNKTNESAWDADLLATELADLNIDLTAFGFDAIMQDDIHEDEFDETPPAEPITKPGDIWLLGRHRLMCGDATNPSDVQMLMDGLRADLCVTDPPYNCDLTGKTKDALKIRNDKMDSDSFYAFLFSAFKNVYDNLVDGGAVYIFHSDAEKVNFYNATVAAGFHYSTTCIWVKNSMVIGRMDYQMRHEPVLYGFKDTARHNWYSNRKQTTIWEYDRPAHSRMHPSTKPIPLIAYPITNSSQPGERVLDTFGGSGSTMIACEQTGRVAYLMELDPKYADVIVNRFIKQAGTDEGVFVQRDGERIPYALLAAAKEM
ncbi:site-specific DNA-methyltransferase [Eubacteriales bacterium OttesenSCG-928-N13]|nr:site-specific DNA-methyltransferase [Eubacteriales bacterium OttesenSCG-928-N13]